MEMVKEQVLLVHTMVRLLHQGDSLTPSLPETMENVLGRMNKVILDGVSEGQGGVVPYLPLNELSRPQPQQGGN